MSHRWGVFFARSREGMGMFAHNARGLQSFLNYVNYKMRVPVQKMQIK